MYAIISQGGKQYRVAAGDEIVCDRVKGSVGGPVSFERLLLVSDGENIIAADSELAKYGVQAELVENFNDDKVLVFKYRAKKGYRRTHGHRQQRSRIKILAVGPGAGAGKSAKAKAEPIAQAEDKTDKPVVAKKAAVEKAVKKASAAAKKSETKVVPGEKKKAAGE